MDGAAEAIERLSSLAALPRVVEAGPGRRWLCVPDTPPQLEACPPRVVPVFARVAEFCDAATGAGKDARVAVFPTGAVLAIGSYAQAKLMLTPSPNAVEAIKGFSGNQEQLAGWIDRLGIFSAHRDALRTIRWKSAASSDETIAVRNTGASRSILGGVDETDATAAPELIAEPLRCVTDDAIKAAPVIFRLRYSRERVITVAADADSVVLARERVADDLAELIRNRAPDATVFCGSIEFVPT